MRKAPRRVAALARRLLRSHVPGQDLPCPDPGYALARSLEALRPRLTELVGRDGLRALLTRALALVKRIAPWLDGVGVDPEGKLDGLDGVLLGRSPEEAEDGCSAVLANFLGLLVAFVGTEITRRIVSGAWPGTPMEDADLAPEEDET